MTSPLGPDSGLFAGTAWHYARYRPGYPQAFVDDLVTGLSLDGTRRLLDLGCGTGQLTIPLAPHVAEAVGMDPEPEMLTEAAKSARSAGITNVTWAQGNSADLPGDFGRFLLVIMGRSFHWMDREQVLTALDAIVDHDGAVVLANDSCLVRPNSPWQQAVEDIQHRFLPPDSVRPTPLPGRMNSPADHQPHEQILARSAFRHVDRRVYEFERPWAVEQVIGYLYSTSLPLRRLLGDRLPAFELEITDTLHMFRHNGLLIEPVTLEVLIGTKQ